MKKVLSLVALTLLCTACDNKDIPADIKDFVNGIDFRVVRDHLESGTFKQTYVEHLNGEVSGENSIDFTFSSADSILNFNAKYSYSGNQIKDGITSKEVELLNNSPEGYTLKVSENDVVIKEENINYEGAYEYYYKIFDSGLNSYRIGGLYYGDFFAINMNKFYKLYSLNEDKSILKMTENNGQYYDNLKLFQEMSIDKNGMLLYKREHAMQEASTNDGLLIQEASYIYN